LLDSLVGFSFTTGHRIHREFIVAVHNFEHMEENDHEEQWHQTERSLVDRLIIVLGANPREWSVGDRRLVILTIVMVMAIVLTAVCGYVFGWEWTGLTTPKQRTFWDWLNLLIVPAVLALGGYLYLLPPQAWSIEEQRQNFDA